jgi:hypothetical protein
MFDSKFRSCGFAPRSGERQPLDSARSVGQQNEPVERASRFRLRWRAVRDTLCHRDFAVQTPDS